MIPEGQVGRETKRCLVVGGHVVMYARVPVPRPVVPLTVLCATYLSRVVVQVQTNVHYDETRKVFMIICNVTPTPVLKTSILIVRSLYTLK